MTPTVLKSSTLQQHIDRCVMCGLCSQHCPTYNLTQDESESPRGRIALINAANRDQLSLEGKAREHLDHCVSCRACESFCPSGVRFGAIMDEGHDLMPATPPDPGQIHRLQQVLDTVKSPEKLNRLGRWLGRYQRWGIQAIARHSGLLKLLGLADLETLLPRLPANRKPFPKFSPATPGIKPLGAVALFTGCISRLADYHTLDNARRLLNRLGYDVHIPRSQGCCGALHRHNGDTTTARDMGYQNLDAFSALNIEAILHTATGCTAQLQEYADWLGRGDHDKANAMSDRVQDINQFLVKLADDGRWPEDLKPRALKKTVIVHESCSLKNVLQQADAPSRLLEHIPQLSLVRLPASLGCCGAAGSYMLTQKDFSQAMRDNTLQAIQTAENGVTTHSADYLVTANIGCALHIGSGLRGQNKRLEVIHPLNLLAQQLDL